MPEGLAVVTFWSFRLLTARKGGGWRSDDLHIHTCRWWWWFCRMYFFDSVNHISLFVDCFNPMFSKLYIYILQGVFLRRVRQEEVLRWFAHSHLSLMVVILLHAFLWFCIRLFVDPIPHVLKVHFQILQMSEAGRSSWRSDDLHMHTCLSSKLCTY